MTDELVVPPRKPASSGGLPGVLATVSAHLRDPLYRNGYALVANAGLSSALGLIYWVVVARLYTSEAVGRSSAIISAIIFLSGIAQLNLRPVMGRFLPVAGTATMRFILGGYLAASLASAVAAVAFIVLAPALTGEEAFATLQSAPIIAVAFAATVVLWSIFSVQDGVLIGLRRTMWVPVENILFGIGKLVLAALLAGFLAAEAGGVIASWIIPMIGAVLVINGLILGRTLPRMVSSTPATGGLISPRGIARFVAGDYVGSLFALAYISLLPVLVIARVDEKVSAHFYIVWVVITSLQLIPLQMTLSLVVETAADPSSFARRARHLLVQMVRLFIVPLGVLVVGAPLILEVFGPTYAADGGDAFRTLALALVPFTVNAVYFAQARVRARVRGIIAAQAFLAVSILGLTVILLPSQGLSGVGIAYLAGQTAMALFVAATALRTVFLPAPRAGQEPAARP